MSKRKLSKRQVERILEKRRQATQTAADNPSNSRENLRSGLVITRFGNKADIETDSGEIRRCSFRKHLGSPVAGDRVFWRADEERGVIESLYPRSSALLRPDAFGNMKAIAANIDCMMLTLALKPEPHSNLIDRYLVAAANLNLKTVIIINKYDLINASNRHGIDEIIDCYSAFGIPIVRLSAKTRQGFSELQSILCAHTSVFVGQSGVGKSSILQNLMPNEQIKVGDNSDHLAKGKHTTTNAKLYHFPLGGDCIDSPGVREFGLWHLRSEQVIGGFPDLLNYAQTCRFRDCSHQHEPGCGILQALQAGDIERDRFDSFKSILLSLEDVQMKTKDLKPE